MAVSRDAVALSEPPTQAESACFHCGLPVPAGDRHSIVVEGRQRPLCCAGCQAVAQAIVSAGLTDFYHHRSAASRRIEDLVPDPLREWRLYDRADLQKGFVRVEDEHVREAALILEGIVCAACVWLNERHVGALPGVLDFRVNYSTHRARVRWDERKIKLSEILAAIAAIGYRAHPFDLARQESLHSRERAAALRRVAVAGLGAMQVMMLAVALYVGEYQGMDEATRRFLRWISLLITGPVVLYAARPFFAAAWRDLRQGRLGMDVPVSLAIGGAFIASSVHTWRGGEVYFDSVAMFTFLLLGTRFLEMGVRHRVSRISEELVRLLPATATRLTEDNAEQVVPVADLAPGDRVLIRPGETVPADGCVLEGASSVDESLLSGESLPLSKQTGARLVGGSVNVESPLIVRIEKVGADTVLAAIVRLLDRAQSEKPRIALLADRVAGWFVAGLLVVAAGVGGWWWWSQGFDAALAVTLAVLVVTCPCALSLATPAAIAAATGSLTRLGLLITRGHALEALARTTHVVFDKTGTLSFGRLRLVEVAPLRELDAKRCLAIAGALERGSEHPIGRALTSVAEDGLQARHLKNFPGQGVEGWLDGRRYRVGKAGFVTALSGTSSQQDEESEAGITGVTLGDEQGLLARLQFADALRPEAAETVAALKNLGLKVILLSGDRSETVQKFARQLAIERAEGGLLPQDKLERIRALQAKGAVVTMVGDGINDAPVLAAAQVSLAMGGGTQLAHASADMVLFAEDLRHVVRGVEAARRTLAVIRQNLGWAVGYNLVALPLAAGGWLLPWMAALGMSLSSLLVVANALRLKDLAESQGERRRIMPGLEQAS